MKRRWLGLLLLGLIIYALVLAYRFPAAWALHWSRDRIPPTVEWGGVSGSVLDARVARLALTVPGGGTPVIGPVEWRTSLHRAVFGHMPLTFRAEALQGEVNGQARLQPGGWRLPVLKGRFSLAALPEVLPQLAMAQVEGRVLFRARDLQGGYAQPPQSGKLRATVEGLAAGLIETDRPLGDYQVALELQSGGQLAGEVTTVNDDALLRIQGRLRGDLKAGRLRFNGRGEVPPDAPAMVRDILPLLGSVNGDRVRIQWQGRLR